MVDLVVLQSASYVAAAIGVCAAAVYYIMVLRATQQNMKITLETRQTQLYMQIYQQIADEKFGKNYVELLNMTWKDYDDFEKKYGSDEHPEKYALRWNLWYISDGVGYMVRRGMIDVETVLNLGGSTFKAMWEKSKDIVIEQRRRYGLPGLLNNWEYLVNEIKKWENEHEVISQMPSTYLSYVPGK
jgi:hypothetical protein